jgi:phosphopantothenoylcysteine decarboxylase/phosphopantothenate--cysteine ligase
MLLFLLPGPYNNESGALLLTDKKIILGISGSIAVYKAADWVRDLRREGALVKVIMTADATRFVAPLTFAALTGNKVYEDMFDPVDAEKIPHITLAAEADLVLIAPATARTIARVANGMADDLLSTVVLASKAPVVICPAMNSNMYENPATVRNLELVREFGHTVVEPGCGNLACNTEGPGRLAEWDIAKEAIYTALSEQDMVGQKVLVTAGPTYEPMDPVRYLGNRSTGRMGYAMAVTARRRGANVTLVSGPANLTELAGVEMVRVNTADEMSQEVLARSDAMDIVVMAAAVSDFRPAEYSTAKLKKSSADLTLKLAANQDILKTIGEKKKDGDSPVLVGFAAESHDLLEEGQRKLTEKNLDIIAVNDITAKDAGFAVDTNRITILDNNGSEERLPLLSKEAASNLIWNRVVKLLSR